MRCQLWLGGHVQQISKPQLSFNALADLSSWCDSQVGDLILPTTSMHFSNISTVARRSWLLARCQDGFQLPFLPMSVAWQNQALFRQAARLAFEDRIRLKLKFFGLRKLGFRASVMSRKLRKRTRTSLEVSVGSQSSCCAQNGLIHDPSLPCTHVSSTSQIFPTYALIALVQHRADLPGVHQTSQQNQGMHGQCTFRPVFIVHARCVPAKSAFGHGKSFLSVLYP